MSLGREVPSTIVGLTLPELKRLVLDSTYDRTLVTCLVNQRGQLG